MSCCRAARASAPKRRTDSSVCLNCQFEMKELYLIAAAQSVKGKSASIIKDLNCPKCNTLNSYKVTFQRKIQTS